MNPMAAAMMMQSMQSMGGMPGMRPPLMGPAGARPGSTAAPKAEPAAGGGPGPKQEPGREGPPGFDGRRYGGQEGRYERPDWEREREREGRFYDGPRGGGGPYRQAGAAAAARQGLEGSACGRNSSTSAALKRGFAAIIVRL